MRMRCCRLNVFCTRTVIGIECGTDKHKLMCLTLLEIKNFIVLWAFPTSPPKAAQDRYAPKDRLLLHADQVPKVFQKGRVIPLIDMVLVQQTRDRKSGVEGKSVSGSLECSGG